ncbi:hypothetical protein NECID01_1448 [Nematocida sp. AWRm77]|nr:hypothetical protein NECID01_1448 [Nematocida sp. AWRm77]
MNRLVEWIRGRPQNDIKIFFERTTEECFSACVGMRSAELTPKEAKCVEACAKKRIELLRAIEEAMEAKLKK